MAQTWAEVWEFRDSLYSFLGDLILEPIKSDKKELLTYKFWYDFPLGSANNHLKSGLDKLTSITEQLERLNSETAINEVMVEYTELFLGPGRPKAPPFETFYHSDKKVLFGETTTFIKNKLIKYGLESKNKGKLPEDHLGLELLYIAVLSRELASLKGTEQHQLITESLSFIENHLLNWVPQLCTDAKKYSVIGFYAGIYELILGTLHWDIELLKEYLASEKIYVKG